MSKKIIALLVIASSLVLTPLTLSANVATSPVLMYAAIVRYGQVNAKGEVIVAYNTDYVCNNGKVTRQRKCDDGCPIVARNTTYSKGIQWYECWNPYSGEYYGWIDGEFLFFYY